MFVGEYDRSVDGNGRVALPADFRDELSGQCYLTADPEGCVTIMSAAAFEQAAAELLEQVKAGRVSPSSSRAFAAKTSVATIDKQGRITIEDQLRRHAGLRPGGDAVIVGRLTSLELWRDSRYSRIRSEDDVEQRVRHWDDEDDE